MLSNTAIKKTEMKNKRTAKSIKEQGRSETSEALKRAIQESGVAEAVNVFNAVSKYTAVVGGYSQYIGWETTPFVSSTCNASAPA